ncbi:MAG: leucine-rich repeat protein [Clostridia bacterium]|nr:leucine-rich repeat protein [Clostridia bacterium]
MRNKKRLSLMICTVLLLVTVLTSVFTSVLSATHRTDLGSSPYVGLYNGDLTVDTSQYYNGTTIFKLPSTVDDNDEISLIVQMGGTSLLDAYDNTNTDLTFTEYYKTSEAGELKANIVKDALDYCARLSAERISYVAGDVYDTLFDGFEITVKAKDFVKVCETLGDDVNVIVGEVYNTAETQLVENNVNAFDTGIFDTTGFGYDGTGIVVAVLDTGLDYYHTAFSMDFFTAPESEWALTFEDIESVISETVAAGIQPGLTASDVYISGKVPFGFDYADNDSDIFPINSEHGTHVSGIILGHDETITGVAPNAQLVNMKIFSDLEQSARSAWILSALEDCVTLGVDVINMSLGTSCGFSRVGDKEAISGVYDDIRDRGISLVVAASNDYNSSYGSEKNGNLPLTSNPDSATVGSPSTYKGAISVASIEGVKTSYLLYGERIIYFNESNDRAAEEKDFVKDLLGDALTEYEFDYVTIPGTGIEADYTGLDVKDKIALIRRGSNTFEDKANMAQKMGAAGAIIYNNVSGDIKMTVGEATIAVCSISQDDGEALAAHATGKIKVSYSQEAGPFMSDFSSWGPTPDLNIKPEITAHGGSILSAVPGQDYDRLSGTSMAAPNMAGVTALLRQYVEATFPEHMKDTPAKVTAAVYRLLMSTADITYNKNGNPYSIRKQGAGLANIQNSAKTTAYILTYDRLDGSVMDKSKIELGDDPEKKGVYELVFTIDNFGKSAVSYDVSAIVMTEGVSETFTNQGETTVTEMATLLEGANVAVTKVSGEGSSQNGSNVSVEAGKQATVTVTITLSEENKKYLNDSFENGMYVEGFVTLKAATETTAVDLNVPYLAFYGDWTEAPLFDIDYYETNKDELDDSIDLLDKNLPDAYATRPVGSLSDDYVSYMGSYHYDQKPGSTKISADRKYISITNQPEGVNNLKYIWAGMLRNAERAVITIVEDSTGEVVFTRTETDIRKSFGRGGPIYPASIDVDFSALDRNLKNNATYTVTVKTYVDYDTNGEETNDNNTFTFPLTVDFEAPTLTGCEFYTDYDNSAKKNRLYAKMSVYDNHYSMAAAMGYVSYNPDLVNDDGTRGGYQLESFDRYTTPIYSSCNTTSYLIYELTDFVDDIKAGSHNKNTFTVSLMDYALNQATYEVALPMEYIDLYFEKTDITLSPNQLYDLSPIVYPETEWGELVDYESKNESVARVVRNKIIAIAPGEAVINATVTLEDGTKKQQKLNIKVLAEGEEGYKKYSKPVTDNSGFSLTGYTVDKAYYFMSTEERDLGLEDAMMNFVGNYYALKMFPSESVTVKYELHAFFPEDTEDKFTSSNKDIVKVDEKTGQITAVKEGYASISITVRMDDKDTSYRKSIQIEVKDPYVTNGPYLTHYFGNGGIVSIPSSLGLTEISQYAFSNYEYIPKDENDEISEEDPSLTKIWYIGDDTIEEVIIPEGVKTIGPFAFANLTRLRKVTLPKSIVKIDKNAFFGCTSLTTVAGIENVKFINQHAFADTALDGTIALNSAVAIGDYAFANNKLIDGVILSKETQSVGAFAFTGNTSMTTLTTASNKLKLGKFAFNECEKLSSVSINAVVIPTGAFNDCKALTVMEIGPDVSVIGEYAFRNTKIASFRVAEGNTTFYPSSNTSYLLNAEGTEIMLIAPTAKTLNVTDSKITSIANGAGSGNTVLESVNIPSVTSVGSYAFSECTNLATVTLGTLTYVGDNAFDATAIRELPKISADRIGAYAFAGTLLKSVTIADGMTVGEGAFNDCRLLESVTIGKNVTLGDYAFAYNTSRTEWGVGYYNYSYVEDGQNKTRRIYYFTYSSPLESLTIGEGAVLGKGAFFGAASITDVTLGKDAVVGDYAFYNNCALENIDLSGVITIGEHAFSGDVLYQYFDQDCTSGNEAYNEDLQYMLRYYSSSIKTADLSSITAADEKVSPLGVNAFAYCAQLESVILNENTTYIPENIFMGCEKLTSVNLDKVTSIGSHAFAETALIALDLPVADDIAMYAFAQIPTLTSVTFGAEAITLGEGVFAYCDKLATVTGMGKIKSVGDYAFAYTDLSAADLTSAEYLGMHAFIKEKENAKDFTVILGEGIKEIGDNPFAYCNVAPFYIIEKEEFNGTEYEKAPSYTYSLGEFVRIIDGSLYRVVPAGLELITYCPMGSESYVAEGTTRISAYAFANTDVVNVILPYTLKAIGHKAFFDCDKLSVVTFTSYMSPRLEEEYDIYYYYSYENFPTDPSLDEELGLKGLGIVDYFMWNATSDPSNIFYGASFIDYIGHLEDKIVMVKPVNGEQYTSFILDQYFDVAIDGASAADDATLAAIAAIDLIPEKVTLADKPIVEAARAAYAKISLNEQKALVKNYQKLLDAEKRITNLEFLENDKPTVDDEPEPTPNEGLPVYAIILIIAGSVIALGGIGVGAYFLIRYLKARKPEDDGDDNDDGDDGDDGVESDGSEDNNDEGDGSTDNDGDDEAEETKSEGKPEE